MRFQKVFVDAIAYNLPTEIVRSSDLEHLLGPLYSRYRFPVGQLEQLTGIIERRWWHEGFSLTSEATAAASKALGQTGITRRDIDMVVYAGVCRESFEPATACGVAHELGVPATTAVYDVSNACLGVLNAMIDVANRIELGQIRCGVVVACESAREITQITVEELLANAKDMDNFSKRFPTLTGGSASAAIVLTDGSFSTNRRRRLIGGVTRTAPQHHRLCQWGLRRLAESRPLQNRYLQYLMTDAFAVLKYGVALGIETWRAFLTELSWTSQSVNRVIAHQVGRKHRDTILNALGIGNEKDFSSFPFLGNTGSASIPVTAALAEEQGFLRAGDTVSFLGIGSGLNCLMLGLAYE